MHRIIAIGAGGHAQSVIDAIQKSTDAFVQCILDNNSEIWGSHVLGVPVIGADDQIGKAISDGCNTFVIAMATVGKSELRKSLYEQFMRSGLAPYSIRHPTAVCSEFATVGHGVQQFAGSIIGPSAVIHDNVVVNTSAVVEHECVVGPHTHVAPKACLGGNVQVGSGCHIGIGAVVKENVHIGERAIIGAGAVVLRNVPAGVVVAGVPARPLKGHSREN